MIRVVNASRSMSWEEVQPHVEDIKAHFAKLQRRFPTDTTVQALLEHVLTGRRDLWLIFDEDKLLATACTALETIDATGTRICRLMDLGGSNIKAWAEPLRDAIETWGEQHSVDYFAIEGRAGWDRVIRDMGYVEHARLWRKRAA